MQSSCKVMVTSPSMLEVSLRSRGSAISKQGMSLHLRPFCGGRSAGCASFASPFSSESSMLLPGKAEAAEPKLPVPGSRAGVLGSRMRPSGLAHLGALGLELRW